jgi:2'-5' RNA ligase
VLGHRELQKALRAAMLTAGVKPKGGAGSEPHITLLYDDLSVPKQGIEPIRWSVAEFRLIRSLVGKGEHHEVKRWALR